MARIRDAFLNLDDIQFSNRERIPLDLGEGQFDAEGKPTVLHQAHVVAAYEFIGTPWFCGYVGDSMGNQIRLRMAK